MSDEEFEAMRYTVAVVQCWWDFSGASGSQVAATSALGEAAETRPPQEEAGGQFGFFGKMKVIFFFFFFLDFEKVCHLGGHVR